MGTCTTSYQKLTSIIDKPKSNSAKVSACPNSPTSSATLFHTPTNLQTQAQLFACFGIVGEVFGYGKPHTTATGPREVKGDDWLHCGTVLIGTISSIQGSR